MVVLPNWRENRDATRAVGLSTKIALEERCRAHCCRCAGVLRNRHEYPIRVGICRNRMDPTRCFTIGPRCHELIRPLPARIDDVEPLRRKVEAAGAEVVAISWVEPDFVITPLVRKLPNDRASVFVNNNGIEVLIGRPIATAQQDLLSRPNSHSRRRRTIVDGDYKGLLN